MKKMIGCDREIHIVSGHNGAGKSRYFEFLGSLPEYRGKSVFRASKDTMYLRYYGDRTGKRLPDTQDGYLEVYNAIAPSERLYTDELLRADTERAILLHGAKTVLLDVVMRTHRYHQRPFVAMMRRVEKWVRLIEADRATAQKLLPPDPASRVRLRVALLFCDFATVRRRLTARWTEADWKIPPSFVESTMGFEVPRAYSFLAINTSDESLGSEERRKEEMREFFGGKEPDPAVMAARAREARDCVADIKKQIRKVLREK